MIIFMSMGNLIFVNTPPQIAIWTANMVVSSNALVAGLALVTYRGGAARCCAFIYWLSHSILEVVLPHGISSSQGKKVVQGKECPVTVIIIIMNVVLKEKIYYYASSKETKNFDKEKM